MADKILVTGGSGKLGRAVIAHLQEQGYQVINADQNPDQSVHTIKTDLCDLGQVYGLMDSVSAVVHLAAIPSPGGYPPEIVFHNNVMPTFNILQAATTLGIKKVILASSLSALGLAYKFHPVELQYLPIDEKHPVLAQDSYGISKIVGEQIAEGFSRRNPAMSLISFRFPLLANPGEIKQALQKSAGGHIGNGELILWSYLDIRDAAIVIMQALQHQQSGHEILYVNAPNTYSDIPTIDLIKTHFPDVPYNPEKLQDFRSPIDCHRVQEVLNFQPRFTWQSVSGKESE